MFTCYICLKAETSVNSFRAHLKRHSVVGELILPLSCFECKSTFSRLYNLIRHVHSFHCSVNEAILDTSQNMHVEHTDDVVESSDINVKDVVMHSDMTELHDFVKNESISLVASLRANSSVPYDIIPPVIDSFNSVCSSICSINKMETLSSLSAAGVDSSVIAAVEKDLDKRLSVISQPLDFLSTRYRQDQYFDKHPLAVMPETVILGSEIESHGNTSKISYESFQYISVKKTLQSLLTNKHYVELLLEGRCNDGILTEYADGDHCKLHPLFGDASKLVIQIQLFYDGLGVTNPLRGVSVLHNIGVFFFTIRNLPNKYNSCFANVHLLALCYTMDIKKYGFDPILERFVHEINELSTNGFEVDLPGKGKQTVYASLCQVLCDNLALNGILGFVESFSCDYFCTICYATQNDIQIYFREENFELRTFSAYSEDIACLDSGKAQHKKHCRGVKHNCMLNNIDGFHVTNNWSLDIMHIVLEGIVPFELGCILHGLCCKSNRTSDHEATIDYDTINAQINLFWGKISVEKKHKPLELKRLDESGLMVAPSMKAVQYFALLKYLPLVIGTFIQPNNEHWKFLLHLCHLVDLLYCPRFTVCMVKYLRCVIEDHLSWFVALYGNNGAVRLRPKHHLLIHLPSIILKAGPLVGMSAMRYELKNSFFKRSAHVVCNFKNICKTLAYRHQCRFLYSLLSNDFIRDVVNVGVSQLTAVCTLPFSEVLCENLVIEATDDIAVSTKLSIGTVEYAVGHIVITGQQSDTTDPFFGRIVCFVSCLNNDQWLFVVESMKTIGFYPHFHAYSVSDVQPPVFTVLRHKQLVDYHPLYCHSMFIDGMQQKYVRLPYHIFSI